MPATKYALIRYRIIDKYIRNKFKPFPTKEDLRLACEEHLYGSEGERVSASTIEKDIWAMRNETALGYLAPIKFNRLKNGYFYEDPEYSIDSINLNEEEIEAIRFAATTLHQFRNIEIFKDFDYAIGKIFDRLNISPDFADKAINKYVQFETALYFKGSEFLSTLLASIKERNIVAFDHENFTKETLIHHKVHPYLLKEYRNRWYLIGFDEGKESVLTFGLDRLSNLLIEKGKFTVIKNFNADAYFKHCIGITSGNGEPKEIVLSFEPVQGKYIKSQPLHSSQKEILSTKKEYRISLKVFPSIELLMHILSFGEKVAVISPLGLKNQIREVLRESLTHY